MVGGSSVVAARVTNEQQPHAAAALYGDDRVTHRPTASPADGTRTTFGNGDAVAYRGMEKPGAVVEVISWMSQSSVCACHHWTAGVRTDAARLLPSGGGSAPAVPRWGTAASSSRLATTCIASVVCEQQVQLFMPISLVELYIQRPMREQLASTVIRGAIKSN